MKREEAIERIKERLAEMGVEYGEGDTELTIKKGDIDIVLVFNNTIMSVSCWMGHTHISSAYSFYSDLNSIHGDKETMILSFGSGFTSVTLKGQG